MERKKKTDSKEVMDEGTLRGVLYMMREEAHLTLKEKKNARTVLALRRKRPQFSQWRERDNQEKEKDIQIYKAKVMIKNSAKIQLSSKRYNKAQS